MLIEPADLTATDVAAAVRRDWNIEADTIRYAPVGFGSHHWWITTVDGERWFATIDDLRMGDRSQAVLVAALKTAHQLHELGIDSVVAPIPSESGSICIALEPHYVLAVYPLVDGITAGFGRYESAVNRLAVLHELVRLHDQTSAVREIAPVADFDIPKRSALHVALEELDQEWTAGPFAAKARELLLPHRSGLVSAMERYDALAQAVSRRPDRWVLTHGEPHRANVIVTDVGVKLIDWETTRLAPPERDLWMLIDEEPELAGEYTRLAGTDIDNDALGLYRLWWDLCEVSLYTTDLSESHEDNAETSIAWAGLQKHLMQAVRATH